VAIKILPAEYGRDVEYIERFLREARAAARLNHPNIVQVYDAGVYEGHYFFVMEWIRGRNVGDLIRGEQRISERDAIRMILQAALGLGFAHHAGIIHRDVKPENLIMTEGGTIKICDLGLAKWGFSQVDKRITQSGMTIGTPHYIAPEQVRGVDVDHRADIYSLGASFYHILTGKQPFEGENHAEVMLAHLKKPFPDPRHIYQDLSVETVELVKRMTQKDVNRRFQSMDEVVDAACLIIGAKEVEGMVSPEVGKRLSQRFMEKSRARVSTKSGNTTEIQRIIRIQRWKAMAGWLFAAVVVVLGWSYWNSMEADRELRELQAQMQREQQRRPRAVVREIELPTEEPRKLQPPRERGKPSPMPPESPDPRALPHEAAPAHEAPPRSAIAERPAQPRQVTLEIPAHLLWQVSIHPNISGDDKRGLRPKRIFKDRSADEPESMPQAVRVSGDWRGLMKFDIKQMIKSGEETTGISKAWLVLIPASLKVKTGTFDMDVYRMQRPWGRPARRVMDPSGKSESELPQPEIVGVNWQQAEKDDPWGAPGADKDAAAITGTAIDRARKPTARLAFNSSSPNEAVKIDITEDVRAWLQGEPNYGWIFVGKGFGMIEFFSGDDPKRGPKLILVFE
jgi:hypothetical protein